MTLLYRFQTSASGVSCREQMIRQRTAVLLVLIDCQDFVSARCGIWRRPVMSMSYGMGTGSGFTVGGPPTGIATT
ncbi:hypothetical protein SBI_01455 [Streptomyces bingchenggensis BCW-1]|uniref:Uncharacterized protein n=1 Tax=Streptomyces bingchenggensis (strain BCW-1) TaxID=749414 RepID=D7CDR1_STRBB|nr:hypothetical protein SBI_01455 [Streptomyces bingchenggensis BCW-1]